MDTSQSYSTKSIFDRLPTEIVQNVARHLDVASEACFILCGHFIKSIVGTSSWTRVKDDKMAQMALLSRLGSDSEEYDYCIICGILHGFDKPTSLWSKAAQSPAPNKDIRPFPILYVNSLNWSTTEFWSTYPSATRNILRGYSAAQSSLSNGVKPNLGFKYLFEHALTEGVREHRGHWKVDPIVHACVSPAGNASIHLEVRLGYGAGYNYPGLLERGKHGFLLCRHVQIDFEHYPLHRYVVSVIKGYTREYDDFIGRYRRCEKCATNYLIDVVENTDDRQGYCKLMIWKHLGPLAGLFPQP